MIHVTKAGLYKLVNTLRCSIGIDPDDYGIDILKHCEEGGVRIEYIPFCSSGLRGMAIVGGEDESDVILLNSARNKTEQNMDCAHECMHLTYHRDEPCRTFKCFDTVAPGQDKYLEWQANEGGAEILVPHRGFLRRIKRYEYLLHNYQNISAFKKEMASEYNVTEAVITFRLESLKYEISQYLAGTALDDIRILSNRSQIREGICIKSLNDIAHESYVSSDFAFMAIKNRLSD